MYNYKAIKYYVSDHINNGLLLHTERCEHLPQVESRAFIGSCYTPKQAIAVALVQYASVTYCPLCLGLDQDQQTQVKPLKLAQVHVSREARKPQRKLKTKVLKAVRHSPHQRLFP